MVRPSRLETAAIVADLRARPDVPGKVMAHEHGCSQSMISYLRRKHGLRPTIPERIALVTAAVMADPERSNGEVARLIGMSHERVRPLRLLARLPCRQPGPRRQAFSAAPGETPAPGERLR